MLGRVRDLRDPLEAERLRTIAPDEFHTRRDFLKRTAVTAGLAASMGLVLDPDTLVAEAARRQREVALPSPRNLPIDTLLGSPLPGGPPLPGGLARAHHSRRAGSGRPGARTAGALARRHVDQRAAPRLQNLVTSGWLERTCFSRPATPATMFRHPSSLGLRP